MLTSCPSSMAARATSRPRAARVGASGPTVTWTSSLPMNLTSLRIGAITVAWGTSDGNAPPSASRGAGRLDAAHDIPERDATAAGAGGGVAEHDLVAVLE